MADKNIPAGKIPPQNVDAEMSLLGAVLIDEKPLPILQNTSKR